MSAFFSLSTFGEESVAILAAFVLCLGLGIERHFHLKDAGIKTHVLVGVGSCIFTLVSAYGFDLGMTGITRFDPSRIAAQVVSGIGFLGAGVIFVNNDTVRGLTTAATVWLSAAIGMACGARMIPLALVALALHYLLVFAVGPIMHRLPQRAGVHTLAINYESGHTVMPQVIHEATVLGFTTSLSSTSIEDKRVAAVLEFKGGNSPGLLTQKISEIEGITRVAVRDPQRAD